MWIIVGRCRVGGWVVLAAALCYVKSKVRGRVQKQKERNMKGGAGYEKREKLENREVDQRGRKTRERCVIPKH